MMSVKNMKRIEVHPMRAYHPNKVNQRWGSRAMYNCYYREILWRSNKVILAINLANLYLEG